MNYYRVIYNENGVKIIEPIASENAALVSFIVNNYDKYVYSFSANRESFHQMFAELMMKTLETNRIIDDYGITIVASIIPDSKVRAYWEKKSGD